jgi:hypothetical protein
MAVERALWAEVGTAEALIVAKVRRVFTHSGIPHRGWPLRWDRHSSRTSWWFVRNRRTGTYGGEPRLMTLIPPPARTKPPPGPIGLLPKLPIIVGPLPGAANTSSISALTSARALSSGQSPPGGLSGSSQPTPLLPCVFAPRPLARDPSSTSWLSHVRMSCS